MPPRSKSSSKSVPTGKKRESKQKKKHVVHQRLSPDERIGLALRTISDANAARLCLVYTDLILLKVIIMASSPDTSSSNEPERLLRLTLAARALLLPRSITISSAAPGVTYEEDALEAILRRTAIPNPQSVQCMLDGMQQSQEALRELAPCHMSLRDFQERCSGDAEQGALLYYIVQEAVAQCEDLKDYYCSKNPSQRFSAYTLPPFVDGYENEHLDELSNRYWECESKIQRMHKKSSNPVHPGFAAEMVAILCHGFEAGSDPSPIGLNLFQINTDAVDESTS